ncbi:MAG: O-antigen ligase family protein [bacterium]|nr:O-antigen ligase family protein [bacterium]
MFHSPAIPTPENEKNNSMFHVKHSLLHNFKALSWRAGVKHFIKTAKLHEVLFYLFVFLIPIQTRILYNPEKGYIDWYFSYHLGFFLYLSDIVFITLIVVWFLIEKPVFNPPATQSGERAGIKLRSNRLILALFALILVTLFHVKRLDIGIYETIKWLEVLLLVWYISSMFHKKHVFQVTLSILFISGVFQGILAISQFHVQHGLSLSFLGEYIAPICTSGLATINVMGSKIIRAYGTFPHPNVLGAFLTLSLINGYYLVSRASKYTKLLIGLGIILIISAVFLTFSRAAWFTSGAVSLVFLGYYLKSYFKKHDSKLNLVILLTAIVVSCGTIYFTYNDLLVSRATEDINTTAISSRSFFNKNGLEIFYKSPLLGVGVGNYVVVAKDSFDLESWQYQPPHNIFIFLAAELGILGVALFIIILIEILKKAWEQKNFLAFTLFTTMIIFILLSNFDHYFVTIQQGRLMFFTVLGLLIATQNLNHNHVSPD